MRSFQCVSLTEIPFEKSMALGRWLVGGWTNPFEKICASQMGVFPSRGEHKTYLSCHHLDEHLEPFFFQGLKLIPSLKLTVNSTWKKIDAWKDEPFPFFRWQFRPIFQGQISCCLVSRSVASPWKLWTSSIRWMQVEWHGAPINGRK